MGRPYWDSALSAAGWGADTSASVGRLWRAVTHSAAKALDGHYGYVMGLNRRVTSVTHPTAMSG